MSGNTHHVFVEGEVGDLLQGLGENAVWPLTRGASVRRLRDAGERADGVAGGAL
jgi:hypothetical protein